MTNNIGFEVFSHSKVCKGFGANLSFGVLLGHMAFPSERSCGGLTQLLPVSCGLLHLSSGLLGRVVALPEVPWRLPVTLLYICLPVCCGCPGVSGCCFQESSPNSSLRLSPSLLDSVLHESCSLFFGHIFFGIFRVSPDLQGRLFS